MKIDRLVMASTVIVALLCVVGVARAQSAQWDTNTFGWTAPTTCTSGVPVSNCPVTLYKVERAATATGVYAAVGTSTSTQFTHTGAVAGGNCYRVIASSAKGDSVPSASLCFTNTPPSGPPSPPSNLTIIEPIAFTVRPDYGRFAFVRGTKAGMARIGANCDESRVTADGYTAISRPRYAVLPRPAEGTVLVAKCGTRSKA
jgi:hypothetical protein